MRLLTRTTLYFLVALLPLLIVAAWFMYSRFSNELNQRVDMELKLEENQWINYLHSQVAVGASFILRTRDILIYPVSEEADEDPQFETVYAYDRSSNKNIPFRQLTHVVDIYNQPYLISLRRSQEQRTVLVTNVTRIVMIVFVLVFIATVSVNWLINQTVWKPFRRSLQKIRYAELQKMEAIHFENTSIDEFNELNTSLNTMVRKIHSDYVSMKEFTENAAHEMQTPLAVVQSKMELLLQGENLKEEQVENIVQAIDSLSRLSRLNQSLLLLAKIENNQYETTDKVELHAVVKKYRKLFNELISDRNIDFIITSVSEWSLQLHPNLADSLVSNLIGNAVKYNYDGGRVEVWVSDGKMIISNTSELPEINQDQLFRRFHNYQKPDRQSTGLGLAIVKKICDQNGITIQYTYKDGMHHFELRK